LLTLRRLKRYKDLVNSLSPSANDGLLRISIIYSIPVLSFKGGIYPEALIKARKLELLSFFNILF
jgi:hypothetical protein